MPEPPGHAGRDEIGGGDQRVVVERHGGRGAQPSADAGADQHEVAARRPGGRQELAGKGDRAAARAQRAAGVDRAGLGAVQRLADEIDLAVDDGEGLGEGGTTRNAAELISANRRRPNTRDMTSPPTDAKQPVTALREAPLQIDDRAVARPGVGSSGCA